MIDFALPRDSLKEAALGSVTDFDAEVNSANHKLCTLSDAAEAVLKKKMAPLRKLTEQSGDHANARNPASHSLPR